MGPSIGVGKGTIVQAPVDAGNAGCVRFCDEAHVSQWNARCLASTKAYLHSSPQDLAMAYVLLLLAGAVLATSAALWPQWCGRSGTVGRSRLVTWLLGHFEVLGAFFLLLTAMHLCQ